MENLILADKKARRGKSNTYGVRRFDKDRIGNLLSLHDLLKNKTFKTSEYKIFKIFEPKERMIYRLPYFPDRIVHHAIMNILEPIWTSIFTADTYSCIKGRGIHAAMYKIKHDMKNVAETQFCLKLDVKKFYDSIDHEILKTVLQKKIKDADLIRLLFEIIDTASGVPIGNYLSQYFANLYLAYFDHWIKEEKRVKYYYRYADDIVIFSSDKDYLHNLFRAIKIYLETKCKLKVKENWQIFPVESRGVDFLGYVFFHTHVRLRKSIKKNLCRAYRKKKNMASIISYNGWAVHCNSRHLLKKVRA